MSIAKDQDAFRTIREAADELDLPQHVLRFWETRFSQIKPLKRGGGRRYYRPDDVDLLRGIRILLYGEGFTIKGVQRLLKDKGIAFVVAVGKSGSVETVTATEERRQPKISAPQDEGDMFAAAEAESPATVPAAELGEPLSAGGIKSIQSIIADLLEAKRQLDQARS